MQIYHSKLSIQALSIFTPIYYLLFIVSKTVNYYDEKRAGALGKLFYCLNTNLLFK